MTCHLATPNGILCWTPARRPATTGDLRDVTCGRCMNRLPLAIYDAESEHHEARQARRAAEAAEFLGAGFMWSLVAHADDPTNRMVRDILAAVLICLAEQYREERAA